MYVKCSSEHIVGFTNASWANTSDRKSISGYCFSLCKTSSMISWKSKKQPIVALSTCESEYIAIAFAVQEGIFLQYLSKDMGLFSGTPQVHLNVDNMGAIELSKNPVYHQRSKHIDTRFYFIRSKVLEGSFVLIYVPSKSNLADIFTKPCTALSLRSFKVVQ